MKPSILITTIATLTFAPLALLASDRAAIKAPLTGTGDPDATGTAIATLSNRRSELVIVARSLAPSHSFDIEVGGVLEGSVLTDKNGRLNVRFRNPAQKNSLPLDFDPRGEMLRLLDAGASALEGVISGPGEDEHTTLHENVELEHGTAGRSAHARADLSVSPKGRHTFRINVTNMPASTVDVLVDGVEHGQIELKNRHGSVTFDSEPTRSGTPALDFDPRSATIDLLSGDDILFSGKFEAKVTGVNSASPAAVRLEIPSTGVDPDGSASARLRVDDRARKHFSVEVEDVPAGAYDLLVGDTVVGSIQVIAGTTRTQGEIEFEVGDDDPRALPLLVDPVGKVLTIRQGETVFFQGPFNPDLSSDGAPAPEPPSDFREVLTSTGLDADATGMARYRVDDQGRHRFSVEIEKVPAGTYTLKVAGVVRGTILVKTVGTSTVGEVEFTTNRNRHVTRESESGGRSGHGGDDPNAGGGGTTTGGGGADDPAGDDNGGATGGGGADDPAGDHGGLSGGDSDDPAGDDHGGLSSGPVRELPLRFDPRGQTIEISSPDGIFFSHLLGNGSAGAPGTGAPMIDLEVALISSGAMGEAKAKAEFRQREDGRRRFEVEAENLPVGSYDLFVGGTKRGVITVTATEHGTRGEVEFETEPEATENPLNFDVLGQEIRIEQNGTALFARNFPTS